MNEAMTVYPPVSSVEQPDICENVPLRIRAIPTNPQCLSAPVQWLSLNDGPCDAIILFERWTTERLQTAMAARAGRLAPVVDLSGSELAWADYCGANGSSAILADALETIQPVVRRIAALPESVRHSHDDEVLLLARMWTRNAALTPRYDPTSKLLISYPLAGLLPAPNDIAWSLSELGLLRRRFFDRLYVCPACRSSRLSVREECPSCRSPNLIEEQIVHHFSCAWEGPMSSFHRSGHLVCPKCSKTLSHIGLDYDKPGHVMMCRECGQSDAAAAVGFVCLDCSTTRSADGMPVRDWYSYELSTLGEQVLIEGRFADFKRRNRTASDPFRPVLQQAIREMEEFGDPLTVLSVGFARADAIKAENDRMWQQVRALCLEVLQGTSRHVDVVTEHGDSFLVMMPRIDAKMATAQAMALKERMSKVLKVDPGITIAPLAMDQMRAIAEGQQ